MGNEQSNNKYRSDVRHKNQKQKPQDLDTSYQSSTGYYQKKKPAQQPKHVFQPQDKNDLSFSRRNQQLDMSQSRINRNKSQNLRSQVSFEDQASRSAIRSLSPNRSQLMIQSMRDIDKKSYRKRNQIQKEEKLDLIRRASDFCIDALLNNIDYDNSAYINGLPFLTAMVTSQNLNISDKQEDTSKIKNVMKNKTLEEQHLRLQMKRYHPFQKEDRNRFSKLNSSFVDEKYERFGDHNSKQNEQISSLLQSRPYFSQNDNESNLITLNPFEKEFTISEIKPPNRQTFKPLVENKNNDKQKINIKDLITTDQQLSSTTARKSILTPKNDELTGGSPFSNLFANTTTAAPLSKNPKDEYIAIMPVKTNAEVLEEKSSKSQLNQSNYSNRQYISDLPSNINNSKNNIETSTQIRPTQEYPSPSPIIKKTIEINERIIDNTLPNNPNYNNNLNNSELYSRPPAAPKNQQYDYDSKYQSQIQQPTQYNQSSNTKVEYFTSQISTQPLGGGNLDDSKREYNRSVSPNSSALQQQKPTQNHFYPTTQKLQVRVKKVEIPENTDSSKYDSSSESEEEEQYTSNSKGMRLREYEEQQSQKKKKLRKENNLNNTNQSQLNNSYTNINQTSTIYNNAPQQRDNGYNNTTANNSYVTYQPDQSPQNIQYTPQSKFPSNQQQQQPLSQFTIHQVENRGYTPPYTPNTYEPEIKYDDQDQVKRSKQYPSQNNNIPLNIQQQQQQIFNNNTIQLNQQYASQQPQNNFSTTPRQQQAFIDQSLKYSNNQQTFSPQFSQYQINNPIQPQEQSEYPAKMIPFHLPDTREKNNQYLNPRNPDYQNNQPISTTPRSRQPIFSNHSSQQNSIQIAQSRNYPENSQYNQPQQPILNKQALNPQNYEKVIDIKLNESRTETRNPANTTPIYQLYTPRDNSNPPTTSQILNQSYTNINQSQRNNPNEQRSVTPPPAYRNENQTEKIITTTTVYQHGNQNNRSGNNNYNNYYDSQIQYNNKDNQRTEKSTQNIYELSTPQQPYQSQQPFYQPTSQPSKVQNTSSITNTKIKQTNYSQVRQSQPQEEATNVYIVDSPPQSQREIAMKRSLNNSRASSSKKKQRKKTPGRKQNYQRSDNSSEDPSPNSSIYHQEDRDDFDEEDFRVINNRNQNQSQRKSNRSKNNTSYNAERQSRKNRQEDDYQNNNHYNGSNQYPNEDNDYHEQTKKTRKSQKNEELNNSNHPYDQSKVIRTDVEQIQKLYQSTQEEQDQPPYDNYYDKRQNNPQNNGYDNNTNRKNKNRDNNEDNRQNAYPNSSSSSQRQPQNGYQNNNSSRQPKQNMVNNRAPYNNQESETEEDDLQQQPLSANSFYRQQSNGSQKQYNNHQQENYDQYQAQQQYPSQRNRQENLNNSQSSKRIVNNNPQNDQNRPNYNQLQPQQQNYQINPPQQNFQRQNVQPKSISNQFSQRTEYNQTNNTYHHGSDSDTDSGYPHQEIDKHIYPGNKSLSQSQIKKSGQNQSRILPQNINENQMNQNYPYQQQEQQDYSDQKQRGMQKQQSEAILNTRNYHDGQRTNPQQQPQQQNNWVNNTFQPNYSQNSSNNQYNQQQQYPQNQNEGRQLQKVQSDANFLRNNGGNPQQQQQQFTNQQSNLPKILQNSKVKVKLPQNQNILPPQQNQSQGKVKQQQPQQYQQQYQHQPQQSNKQLNQNQFNNRNGQPSYYEDQEEDENQVLRMTLDLSNQHHMNPQNRTSNTIDFNDNEFNDEPVKVQLTLEEIIKKDDSGFFDNQDDLLNSDASSQQANYVNALNQNLQYQNKYIL